ncbi:MAG: DNA polymerase III subunit epsilon [Rhodospirillales bacterium]|nr:DNA polymerase III subunit epsilon [Rhodospirillales bacterium]
MREIILDTETTGLDPGSGHRIVEIGCVELVNYVATGRTFQGFVNPEMEMPAEALAIHGLTDEFLAQKPTFAEVADAFMEFIEESTLVIHNAEFDLGFINAELERLGRPPVPAERAVDTVHIARRKFPGAPASLDALCLRFQIDNSERTHHGALRDAKLLAEVYLELIGGRQPGLELASARGEKAGPETPSVLRQPRPHAASHDEEARHAAFLNEIETPIWRA